MTREGMTGELAERGFLAGEKAGGGSRRGTRGRDQSSRRKASQGHARWGGGWGRAAKVTGGVQGRAQFAAFGYALGSCGLVLTSQWAAELSAQGPRLFPNKTERCTSFLSETEGDTRG